MNLTANLRYSLWLVFAVYCALGMIYAPYEAFTDDVTVAAISVVLFLTCYLLHQRLPRFEFARDVSLQAARNILVAIIVGGAVLRILYVALVPPVQMSDTADYWHAAWRLINEHRYYYELAAGKVLAWRPPGYPFILVPFLLLFGDASWIPLCINLLCFAITAVAAFALCGELLRSRRAGLITAALLALWPGAIAASGLAATELPSLALFCFGLLAYLKGRKGQSRWAIVAGLCTGFGILVRPSLMLYPIIWFVFAALDRGNRARSFKAGALALAATIAVVSPWTIRNYIALDAFVPVSTNGGSVFYRSNNPHTNGGSQVAGRRDIDALAGDEVQWNRTGMQWGMEWIRANPFGFLKLVLQKQALFAGSDETGIYWSLKRAHNYSGLQYGIPLFIANAWWWCAIVLLPVTALRHRRFLVTDVPAGLMTASMLYPVAIHSVFESQPRHHYPILAFLAIFVVMSCLRINQENPHAAGPAQ